MLGDVHRLDAVCAQLGRVEGERMQGPPRSRASEMAWSGLLARLDQDQDAHPATPISRIISTTGAASGPLPRISACLPCRAAPRGAASRAAAGRSGLRCSTGFERAQLRRDRRVARQVDPLEHAHHGPGEVLVDVAPAGHLLLAARAAVVHRQSLQAGRDRPPERVRHADAHLVVARVGRLVAEHDQVEAAARGLLGLDRLDDRRGRGLRVPLLAVGHEVHAAVARRSRASRGSAPPPRPAQRQHGDLAAVLLHQPHGLLHAALLVRADREAEVARLERLLVGGQHHLAAGERHALDADEDPHARDRALPPPSRARCPGRTAAWSRRTAPSPDSARSCTPRRAPGPRSRTRAAGTRAGCACPPTAAPALVTYERRPCESTSGAPSRVTIGSPPSM